MKILGIEAFRITLKLKVKNTLKHYKRLRETI